MPGSGIAARLERCCHHPPNPSQSGVERYRSPVDGATVTAGADIVVTVRLEPGSGRRFWLELGAAAGGGPFRALGPAHAEPVERAALERVPDGLPAGRHVLRRVLAEPSGRIEPENVCDVRVLVR